MELPKFTENLNIIGSLPDRPAMTAGDLKAKFDEGNNLIKKYLNEMLIPELDEKVNDALKRIEDNFTEKLNSIEERLEGIESSVDEKLNDFKEEMNSLITTNSSNYKDFTISTEKIKLVTEVQYGQADNTSTFSKAGYKALGVVGWETSDNNWRISEVYPSSIIDSKISIYVRGNPEPNWGNIHSETTVSIKVLWIKIK